MKRVKIGGLTKRELENSFNEVRLLASLNHKNVIGYREAFYDQKSKTLNIVMEFADDGDLSTKIKQYIKKQIVFDENTIWSTLIQILEGLKYLHKSAIIHRDLKSANIFLTKKGIVKIGDLNVSKIIGKNMAITQTGTPYYASPEIWNDHPYDYKCDIWSAGCIIYEMASLKMPFRGTSMQMLYNNVMKGNIENIPSRYSSELMDIIKLILTKNPKKRPSAEDLLRNPIISEKMEKIGIEKNSWSLADEKAMLIRTIKIPRNINQMNLINVQLPRKNYKKDKYLNQMEMLQNDEYETAKNSFYHPNDNTNNNIIKKKRIINNLNNINIIKDIYNVQNKFRPLAEKRYTDNETNITDINSKNNYSLNKYNCNYNYNYNLNNKNIIRSKSNINNNKNNNPKKIRIANNKLNEIKSSINYKKETQILKKFNNYNYGLNKKEDIFSPQKILSQNQNKKFHTKNTTESLRISTSNIFISEANQEYKIPTSINEPIKLIQNQNINNSIKNVYLKKEEKNKYVPISSLDNGSSYINNIFESQVKKMLNKKTNIPNSISSIQYQSRQRPNKYMQNPSFDNILKNKKTKTLDSQKKKMIQNIYNYGGSNTTNNNITNNNITNNNITNNNITNNSININGNNKKVLNKEILRNKSCKGVIYNNPLFHEDNLVEETLKKKKRIKKNVRRNVSTDYLNRKNSLYNYKDKIHKENNSHIISNNENIIKENLSNNTRVKRIKKQLEDILPPFEFEKILKNRLPSANNNIKRNKNNVNVKININNNYNYINNLNINNQNNNNPKLHSENQYKFLSKNNKNNLENNNYKYYNNNIRYIRPRSTSNIINKEKNINKNNYKHPPMIKTSNFHQKVNKNNLTEITDKFNNNIIKNKDNIDKKYKDFYNLYYQKFLQDKLKNQKNHQKVINFNKNNDIGYENKNYNNNMRKVVYEKINVIQKNGEERKYIKGPAIIRNVGEGNINNQCHREILKYQNNYSKYNSDYSIQNLINKDFKDDKTGPRVILPKKMVMSN